MECKVFYTLHFVIIFIILYVVNCANDRNQYYISPNVDSPTIYNTPQNIYFPGRRLIEQYDNLYSQTESIPKTNNIFDNKRRLVGTRRRLPRSRRRRSPSRSKRAAPKRGGRFGGFMSKFKGGLAKAGGVGGLLNHAQNLGNMVGIDVKGKLNQLKDHAIQQGMGALQQAGLPASVTGALHGYAQDAIQQHVPGAGGGGVPQAPPMAAPRPPMAPPGAPMPQTRPPPTAPQRRPPPQRPPPRAPMAPQRRQPPRPPRAPMAPPMQRQQGQRNLYAPPRPPPRAPMAPPRPPPMQRQQGQRNLYAPQRQVGGYRRAVDIDEDEYDDEYNDEYDEEIVLDKFIKLYDMKKEMRKLKRLKSNKLRTHMKNIILSEY